MDNDEQLQPFRQWLQANNEQIRQEFLDRASAADRPMATDQRLQSGGNKPMAIDQIGQQKSLQKSPQGHQLKLRWSKEKRHAVGFRAWLGITKPEDSRSWGTHDELEALAKIYNVNFVLFETAQTAESQQISIGEDDSPKIFLINTDNRHFDTLEPQVDGSYFRRQQPADGNCLYHSVTPGLLKFIPENVRHNSPNYLRYEKDNNGRSVFEMFCNAPGDHH
jgi:hypothetical protein